MKKYILLIALMGFFLLSFPVLGADITAHEAVQIANQEIGWEHFNIDQVNVDIWNKYEVLVYGGPNTVPAQDQDLVNGEYRYLGYTPLGELMSNPYFPPDDPASTVINNWNWIYNPWENGALKVGFSKWDNKPENEPYIKAALNEKFGTLFEHNTPPKGASYWYEDTKILQPRTSVTPGLGRLWHNWNGSYWYITVIIPSEMPAVTDIEAVSISQQSPVLINTHQVSSAVFRNNGTISATFTARYYACGSLIKEETLDIDPGKTVTKNFSWKSPKTAGTYSLKIHAVPLPSEENIENNTKETSVIVQNYNYTKPDCEFTNKLTAGWNETYSWEVEHSSCSAYTDEEGNSYTECDSWTETVTQTVPYSESLTVATTVNTKQGIPTDRDNPKESDRESRGSWEIIPWAQQNGLNPNEVTRAGYGFEVKVQTTYWTDWETKVPGPASPHGGEYKGPTKVVAQFYNTSGYFVEQLDMVPTKGNPGDKNITWELPIKTHTYPDGQTIYERKHYTDVSNKDGNYGVRIVIFDCGREPLSICQDKYVTIYGDMYDDIYTRPATSNEWGGDRY